MLLKENINYCFLFLIALCIGCANKSLKTERIQAETVRIDQTIPTDTVIAAYIAPYKQRIDTIMDGTLAYAPKALSKKDSRYNTAIGNMMADAVYELANPIFQKRANHPFDAVLLNHGGIRAPLNQGAVTTRTAFNIMPFENEIVVVELSSNHIKELFAYLERGIAHPISGMTIALDTQGQLAKTQIQGQEIEDDKTYFIATTDYLQQGGDRMDFLTEPISKITLDYKMRNVLIDYFKKYDTIAPVVDNRFTKAVQ